MVKSITNFIASLEEHDDWVFLGFLAILIMSKCNCILGMIASFSWCFLSPKSWLKTNSLKNCVRECYGGNSFRLAISVIKNPNCIGEAVESVTLYS